MSDAETIQNNRQIYKNILGYHVKAMSEAIEKVCLTSEVEEFESDKRKLEKCYTLLIEAKKLIQEVVK